MTQYEDRRLMGMVVGWGIGGALFGSILGYLTIAVWTEFLSGGLDWSVAELLFFSLGMVVPFGLLFLGCTQCTAITSQKEGMVIKTCFFLYLLVPWQDVIDMWSATQYSPLDRRVVRKSLITVRRGLTPLHRSLPRKGPQGWQWPRGFSISSAAQGYSDLVSAIEERVGLEQDLRRFYGS